MTQEELERRFSASPELQVHEVELAMGSAVVVEHSREALRRAAFLDDRALAPGTRAIRIPLSDLARLAVSSRAAGGARPLHFIWHTGRVGSTLVSRLVEEVAPVLSLREPLPLRTVADAGDAACAEHALAGEAGRDELATTLLSCWGRGFEDTRAVVVKAPSVTARAAPRLLRLGVANDARSVYLNLRLEPYLAQSLARAGPPVDLLSYGPERARRLEARLRAPLAPLFTLSRGELAAMSWLAETLTQGAVVAEFGDRVLAVDFDELLANVGGGVTRILSHLGLLPDETHAARAAASPLLGQHAKLPGAPYSAALRARQLDDCRARHGDEIRRGLEWAGRLALSEPVVAAVLP